MNFKNKENKSKLKLFKTSAKGRSGTKYIFHTEEQNQVYHHLYTGNEARKQSVEHWNTEKGKARTQPQPLKKKKKKAALHTAQLFLLP